MDGATPHGGGGNIQFDPVADCLVRMWVIDEMKQSVRHPGGERGRRGGKRRAPRRRGMWSSVYTKYNPCLIG